MRISRESKIIFFSIFFLQLVYFLSLLITILIKAYQFSDYSILLVYLFLGSSTSIGLSLYYIKKYTVVGIELYNRLIPIILFQIPSTLMFIFTIIVVITSKIIFN